MTQIMKHGTLLTNRDKLKAQNMEGFVLLKAKRYALFRVQNYLNGGAMAEQEHFAIVKELEDEVKPLGGVKQFAITWDIDPLSDRIIKRDMSVWDAHEKEMEKSAVQLSVVTDGNCLPKVEGLH